MILNIFRLSAAALLFWTVAVLQGCGSGTPDAKERQPAAETNKSETNRSETNKSVENTDPVNLVIYRSTNLYDEEFEKALESALKKRLPYITISWRDQTGGNGLKKQVAAGDVPDIMFGANFHIETQYKPLGLEYDLTPLIKKHQLDLNRFEPFMLDVIRAYAEDGQKLYQLPYSRGFSVMYVNKDIFDKFGVAYPKDGITWDEVADLAKKLTRTDSGVQYYGLTGFSYDRFRIQMGLELVDKKTGKAVVTTDKWKEAFQWVKNLYDIAGSVGGSSFYKDKTIAMYVGTNAIRYMPDDMNWDLVTYPTLKEQPDIGGPQTLVGVAISSTSEHKDAAFQVLETLLSEEVQLVMVRKDRPSPLKSEKLKQEFGKNTPKLHGKNVEAIFNIKPAIDHFVNEYDQLVKKELSKAMDSVLQGTKDINSALREAEEKANQAIDAAKGR